MWIKNAKDEALTASYSVVGTQLPTNVRTFLPQDRDLVAERRKNNYV